MTYTYNNFDMIYTVELNEMIKASERGCVVLVSTSGKAGSWKEFRNITKESTIEEIVDYFKEMRRRMKRFRVSYYDPSTMDHFRGVAIIK